MGLEFNDETPYQYLTRVETPYGPFYVTPGGTRFPATGKVTITVNGTQKKIGPNGELIDVVQQQATDLPVDKKILEKKISKAALDSNKNIYTAPTCDTRLQVGPLTYGAEVQSIRIVENKAVGLISGVRSNSDFVVDSGVGDADIYIDLVFSGLDHIRDGLRPLTALFRVSPITSVDNDVIRNALYSEYSENKAESPRAKQIEDARSVLEEGMYKLKE